MNIVNEIFRSIPTSLSILTFIIYIITHDKLLFYFAFGMVVTQYFVKSIKNIFSYFYSIFINTNKNINLPILGRFSRPEGAVNCGSFYKSTNNLSTSSGMPSSHSILAGFTSIYLYYYLIDKYKIKKQFHDKVLFTCLLFTFYTMYTRILFNCHTIQQTIVGALLGILFGHYYYKLSLKLNSKNSLKLNNTK